MPPSLPPADLLPTPTHNPILPLSHQPTCYPLLPTDPASLSPILLPACDSYLQILPLPNSQEPYEAGDHTTLPQCSLRPRVALAQRVQCVGCPQDHLAVPHTQQLDQVGAHPQLQSLLQHQGKEGWRGGLRVRQHQSKGKERGQGE